MQLVMTRRFEEAVRLDFKHPGNEQQIQDAKPCVGCQPSLEVQTVSQPPDGH